MTDSEMDVAIVGGGVSGVYSGWRLLTADLERSDVLAGLAAQNPENKLSVHLYELSYRNPDKVPYQVQSDGVVAVEC